ncbi:MAG: LUD domain-containing protein [Candidatus Acidiferrales bacterium]
MDLLEQFENAAREAAATVERIPRSPEAVAAAVARAAPNAQRIVVAEPADLPSALFDDCRRLPGVFPGRTKKELSAAEVGITEAFAGVARTGSLCVAVDQADTGYASLLARTHIAVLAVEDIVERPADLFRPDRLNGKGLRRNYVFVTGPSATADMGPLVRGVHGPQRLHILVLV